MRGSVEALPKSRLELPRLDCAPRCYCTQNASLMSGKMRRVPSASGAYRLCPAAWAAGQIQKTCWQGAAEKPSHNCCSQNIYSTSSAAGSRFQSMSL